MHVLVPYGSRQSHTAPKTTRRKCKKGTHPSFLSSKREVHVRGEQIRSALRTRPRPLACSYARRHTTGASGSHRRTCIGPTRVARRSRKVAVGQPEARFGLARLRRGRGEARRCPRGSCKMLMGYFTCGATSGLSQRVRVDGRWARLQWLARAGLRVLLWIWE